MYKCMTMLTLSLLAVPALTPDVMAQGAPPITEAEAQAIAIDAYVYFYSLVTMDVTRRQFTNIEPGKELGKGPMNMFNNVPEYPPANFKGVVRPNFDTLYSIAYLDMTKEPAVVSIPDTNGRYYLLPMLDMWSDVFASPGWRTTGTQAQNYLVTPLGWRADLREGFVDEFKLPKGTQRIEAPTPYVWIIGRTKTDGPPDYDAVRKIQAGLKVTRRLVHAIESATARTQDVKVFSPMRLRDKDSGRLHEHDVVIAFNQGHHECLIALECRDRSRKVGVGEIEAFRTKCEATSVPMGIIVSSKGFAATAVTKAGRYNIGCLSLDEVEQFNWCLTPGVTLRYPECVGIKIDVDLEGSPISDCTVCQLDGSPLTSELVTEWANQFYNQTVGTDQPSKRSRRSHSMSFRPLCAG